MNNHLTPLSEAVSRALNSVKDPISGKGLLDSGRIQGLLAHEDGRVSFTIEAPADLVEPYKKVRENAEKAVSKTRGVKRVAAVLTAEAPAGVTRVRKGDTPAPSAAPRAAPHAPHQPAPQGPPGVSALVAVSSAKGGVGKSTVAVNLACALAALGKRVGILDADVYGPSLPTLLGLVKAQPQTGPNKKLEPIEAFGVKTMSMGYLVETDSAMIWRGPVASGAVRQMLQDVLWAPLDILIIDMPPGTGDIQLTIAQQVPLAGAVIVSTPQEVALADVRRGIAMFEKTHVPVLGIVENMAYFEAPGGQRVAIFGEGGARRTAEAAGVPFLGEVPIEVALRESGDAGKPLVAAQPDHPVSAAFRTIAELTLARLAERQKPAPKISFE